MHHPQNNLKYCNGLIVSASSGGGLKLANETEKTYKIHAIRNTVVSDTCFLKVIGKTLISKVKGARAVAYVWEGKQASLFCLFRLSFNIMISIHYIFEFCCADVFNCMVAFIGGQMIH